MKDLFIADVVDGDVVVRHSLLVRFQHWAIAISGLVLLFSGFGQMPVYKRYMLTEIPGFSWTADFVLHFQIHIVAALIFTFAAIFHLVYHFMEGRCSIRPIKGDVKESIEIIKTMIKGKEEPPHHKFLAEQRLAYAFIGVSVFLLVVTGFVKVLDNMAGIYMPYWASMWSTHLHNLGTGMFLGGFFAHMGAFVIKANWPLLSSMFNGKVTLKYAEGRHPLWMKDIEDGHAFAPRMTVENSIRLMAGGMIITGVSLGALVNSWWYLLPAFVALNLIQSAFTKWCPIETLLRNLRGDPEKTCCSGKGCSQDSK